MHGDWKSIQLPVPEGREMLSVFRGSRPRQRTGRYVNFDTFLLNLAAEEGARVITADVNEVSYSTEGKPIVGYRAVDDPGTNPDAGPGVAADHPSGVGPNVTTGGGPSHANGEADRRSKANGRPTGEARRTPTPTARAVRSAAARTVRPMTAMLVSRPTSQCSPMGSTTGPE